MTVDARSPKDLPHQGPPRPDLPERCWRCRLHANICVCDHMPHWDLASPVTVLMHRREFSIKTNTGHWIPKILKQGSLCFFGKEDRSPVDEQALLKPDHHNLLLWPDPHGWLIDESLPERLQKPAHVVVIDGNWRQAKKMVHKIPALRQMQKITLPMNGPPSNYRLRHGPIAEGVCTYEAVARTLGVLEGHEVQESMEHFFKIFVDRFLYLRSRLAFDQVTGWGE